jgi:hypothetical protein
MSPANATAVVPRISVDDVRTMLDAGRPVTILDVRSPHAYGSGQERIRGDIRVDPEHFRVDPAWPKDRPTVVY